MRGSGRHLQAHDRGEGERPLRLLETAIRPAVIGEPTLVARGERGRLSQAQTLTSSTKQSHDLVAERHSAGHPTASPPPNAIPQRKPPSTAALPPLIPPQPETVSG